LGENGKELEMIEGQETHKKENNEDNSRGKIRS